MLAPQPPCALTQAIRSPRWGEGLSSAGRAGPDLGAVFGGTPVAVAAC
ncbi:hypothetical protein [Streptomyces sp. NPDC006285]